MRWNWIFANFTFIYRLCYKLMLKSLKEGSSLKRESYFGQLDLITWQNFIFTSTFFLKLRLLKWTTYYIDIPWPRWENIRITIEALFLNRQFNSRLSIDNTFFADLLAVTFKNEEFNCVLLKSLTCNGKQYWGHRDGLIDTLQFYLQILFFNLRRIKVLDQRWVMIKIARISFFQIEDAKEMTSPVL